MLSAPSIKSVLPGNSRGGGTSDDLTLTLSGTAASDSVVSLFDTNLLLGSVQSDDTGLWSFTTVPLADGLYNFTAMATGSSSGTGALSATLSVTVHAAAPTPITLNTSSQVVVADGASVEIDGANAKSVTFAGTTGTLKIDDALRFAGRVSGLTGSDTIDLTDIHYGTDTQVTFLGNTAGGILTITDGTNTANVNLEGNYLSSSWDLSSDGNGGTAVVDPVASNNWQPLKVGAGGFVSGIDIANNGTMVVRTDTNGAYIWNGTQWQQLITSTSMPASIVGTGVGTGVYEVQVAANNSNILYMAYEGYVFSSTNAGATWTQTSFAQVNESSNDNYRMNGQKMAIDPSNPNIVYVGTPQNGLFVTTNGGTTWQSVSGVPASLTDTNGQYPGITGILFDPASTNTIFAASYGNGVYESTNGGTSWSSIGGPTEVDYAAVSSSGVYYVVSNGHSDLWSYAGGQWTELANNPAWGVGTVAVDPSNPNHIVYLTQTGMLNQSFNGGATWSGLYNQQLASTDIPWLAEPGGNTANGGTDMGIGGTAFNPSTGGLIVTYGEGVATTSAPAQTASPNSTPVTYSDQSVGIDQLVANEIISPPGGNPVVANWDFGFFYIANLNTYPTVHGPENNFSAGWSIDYASSDPSFIVGLSDWWGSEESGYSTNGGQTWTPFATFPAVDGTYVNGTLTNQQTMGGTIAASTPENIVWAPAGGLQPYYTLNGGATWNLVNLPGVTSWSNFDNAYYLDTRTVTADRVLANTFYMYDPGNSAQGQGEGVYRTTNGGQVWTQVYSGLITPWSLYENEIEAVPGEAANFFFTGGLQGNFSASSPDTDEPFMRSTDGGSTWTAVPNVDEVITFGFGSAAPGQSYPTIYIAGWVNGVYGIWQSSNNAQSWIQIGTYPDGSLEQITTISGDANTYGQVYVGFSGGGYAYLPGAPVVSGVATSPSTGTELAGSTIVFTVTFNSPVAVTGAPTLSLNDGGTATYTGGSGSTALSFSYTVATSDSFVPALAITQVNLPNGATVENAAGIKADLSDAVTTLPGLSVDPLGVSEVLSIVESPASGVLNAGKTITLTLNFNEAVTVTGGIPTLTLNNGGVATYAGGSGTSALTFTYTVASGQNTSGLAATAVNLNSATVDDGAGNAAVLTLSGLTQSGPQIDTTAPSVSSVVETPSSGAVSTGSIVTLTINLSEAVTVAGGTPTLTLNDGGIATYTSGSGTSALTFTYTVASGQNTSNLAATAVNFNSATVMDVAGNAANLSLGGVTQAGPAIETVAPVVSSIVESPASGVLNAGSTVTITLNTNQAILVSGGTPSLTLNDGGVATYVSGSGTSSLIFAYIVAAGQNTSALVATALNLNGASMANGIGIGLSGYLGGLTQTGPQINTTTSTTITSLTETPSGGDLNAGHVVTLTLNLSGAVTVAGGTPTLTLNDGGTATYTGGSGTSALTFSYTVVLGQNTTALAAAAVNLNGATVKDGAGNATGLSLTSLTQTGPQIDTTTPAVSSVAATGTGITGGTGDLNAGHVVTLTVNLSEAVTVAGGTPTLTLNDGGVATYVSGSGTSALTFTYTVAASQNVANLAVTAVNLGTATVKDGAGNAANLAGAVTTLTGLQIDTTTPAVSSVAATGTGITGGTGDLNAGHVVTLTVNLSEAVTVAGGTPTLTLNDGGVATYVSGSGTSALTFTYTVAAGQNVANLAVTAVNLGTATVKDGAGNAANLAGAVTTLTGLQIDTTTPSVSSVAATGSGISGGAGDLNAGHVVTLTVNLSEAVTVSGGTPTLTLNDGGTATYVSGSGTSALTFTYTVAAGQSAANLAVTAANLNSATITDGAGNAANLTGAVTTLTGLQIDTTTPAVSSVVATGTGITSGTGDLNAGHVVTLTVNLSEAVTVAGGTPTLTLNDGGVATYVSGSGTSALTFTYTVAAGQTAANLAVTAVNLGTATLKDGAGNAANLTGAVTTLTGLQIDTTTPSVSSVAASGAGITSGTGDLNAGHVVTLTMNLSEAVTVAGGTPTLTLNDGGTATYVSGSGTSALTFTYTVAAGQSAANLAVTAVNLGTATVTDGAGNAANLTGAVTTLTGLQIDTTTPAVSSVAATGSGISGGTGDLNAGHVVTLTVNLSEAVTVAGGTPTLTLNDGGTATYVSGSGTSALTFTYTVAAGQTAANLAVTAVNLGTATVDGRRRQRCQPHRCGDDADRPADRHHDAFGVVGGGDWRPASRLAPATSMPAMSSP